MKLYLNRLLHRKPMTPQSYFATLKPIKHSNLRFPRELPLVVAKLRKTARGIKALPSDQSFHQGLGWLHYRESPLCCTPLTNQRPS